MRSLSEEPQPTVSGTNYPSFTGREPVCGLHCAPGDRMSGAAVYTRRKSPCCLSSNRFVES